MDQRFYRQERQARLRERRTWIGLAITLGCWLFSAYGQLNGWIDTAMRGTPAPAVNNVLQWYLPFAVWLCIGAYELWLLRPFSLRHEQAHKSQQ